MEYLEQKRYSQDYIDNQQLVRDVIPGPLEGLANQNPFSLRNERVLNTEAPLSGKKREALRESLNQLLSADTVGARNGENGREWRSDLDEIQKGVFDIMTNDPGFNLVRTSSNEARIVPEDV